MTSNDARLFPHVSLGENADVGEFVILGHPARGQKLGEVPTTIGANAVIRSHTVIYAGNRIGDSFQTGHGVLVRENNRIGHRVSVGSHTIVEHSVTIGDGVMIHSNAFVPEFSVLEDGCWIGPGVLVTNARYPRSRGVKELLRGPHIGAGAKIGGGSVLLPGVRIGRDALIGAGAVVVRDVPDGAVVVGNPGRIIKYIDEIAAYASANGETLT